MKQLEFKKDTSNHIDNHHEYPRMTPVTTKPKPTTKTTTKATHTPYKSKASTYTKDWSKHGNYHHTTYNACKHEATLVYTVGETNFFGATKKEVSLAGIAGPGKTLIINCTAIKFGPPKSSIISGPSWLKKEDFTIHYEELHLDWPDFSVPDLTSNFWLVLLQGIQKEKYKTVIFTCTGGHGRTGTALTAILIAQGWVAEDAMDFVRASYCTEAVETTSQELYLNDLDILLNTE